MRRENPQGGGFFVDLQACSFALSAPRLSAWALRCSGGGGPGQQAGPAADGLTH